MDMSIAWVIRLFLAGVYLFSFYSKIKNPSVFFVKMRKYNLLPKTIVPVVGSLFMILELIIGLCMLYGEYIGFVGMASAILLGLFSYAIGSNVHRGNTEIDCGCSGFQSSGQRIGWNLVYRNFFLIVLSLILMIPVELRDLMIWDFLNIAFAVIVMSFLYLSYNNMFSIFNSESYN